MCRCGTVLDVQLIFKGLQSNEDKYKLRNIFFFFKKKGIITAVHPDESTPHTRYAHSASHWSTADTLISWADEILIPYVMATRKSLNLPPSQVSSRVRCVIYIYSEVLKGGVIAMGRVQVSL